MEGQGYGLDGRMLPHRLLGDGLGQPSRAVKYSRGDGSPGERRTGAQWVLRGPGGGVTFPLQNGGWATVAGGRYVPLPGVHVRSEARPCRQFTVDRGSTPHVTHSGEGVLSRYRHDGYGGVHRPGPGARIVGHSRSTVVRSGAPQPPHTRQYLTNEMRFVIQGPRLTPEAEGKQQMVMRVSSRSQLAASSQLESRSDEELAAEPNRYQVLSRAGEGNPRAPRGGERDDAKASRATSGE